MWTCKRLMLCEMMEVGVNSPSDGSTTDKENMRSVRCDLTSIHLVYVRIPGKGITMIFLLAYI
jgi:hypothetical protein